MYIQSSFSLIHNQNLSSISSLESLTFIGGLFNISNSILEDFTVLDNINLGKGGIIIHDNSNLTSIENLKIVSTIHGTLRIYGNENLVDISSLSAVDTINGLLIISNNNSLSNCESICTLLEEGYISSSIIISENLEECNSVNEITFNCSTNSTNTLDKCNDVVVMPNPVIDELSIVFSNCSNIKNTITLLDSYGQIITISKDNKSINVDNIDSGIYHLLIEHEKGFFIKKIIVNK
jgi:hypothetical protein